MTVEIRKTSHRTLHQRERLHTQRSEMLSDSKTLLDSV